MLTIGAVTGVAAVLLSVISGSHFHASVGNGFNVEFGIGSGSGISTLLGIVSLAALSAGGFGYVQASGANSTTPTAPGAPTPPLWENLRNLTLSKKDCQISGVCGGLGEHTPVPTWMWRVMFLVLLLCYGTGLLAYLILAICVPKAP